MPPLDQRYFVTDRVLSRTKINLYLGTKSRSIWPLMKAGGSGGGMSVRSRVVVEMGKCWSNSVDCKDEIQVPMPPGHNYQDWKISNIDIRSGAWIEFIEIQYSHRTSNKTLTPKLGNINGGGVPSSWPPHNLLTNPIVKTSWLSQAGGTTDGTCVSGVKHLESIEFTQAYGNVMLKAGEGKDATAIYTDNFSFWKGEVWLCGMTLHGDSDRVRGIAPHWCYNEIFTA